MWLIHIEQTEGCRIKHARNGREYRLPELPNYSVDGYCEETRTVYEFYGCFYHGHTCQPFRDVSTMSGETLADRYEGTMTRLEQITRGGYEVRIQWECEFDDAGIVKQKPELLTHPVVEQTPLKTRDALYGGRIEDMRLHHEAREDEIIQYVDFISLYPYICKYFKFPIGHPIIHVADACKDKEAMLQKGLIKCIVLPPKRLYHPVLPYRCNNKLLFCLCKSCAIQQNAENECTHETVAERALVGTWVIDEVRMAVQKGYEVIKIYEVYEYDVTQYDRQTGQGGLFVEYIDTFLKIKTEASGYPAWVRTPDDQDRYIDNFYAGEGIRLDKDAIKSNAAKRGLAKLCLNSMWGKLRERNNRTKSKMISDSQELYKFLATPGIEVGNLIFASDKVVWDSWRFIEEDRIPNLRHSNEVIGAYVTAGARLLLYKYLDELQDRAIYCDTDSIVFVQPKDEATLVKFGDNLGDMSSELKPGHIMSEFVSGGPKNYAYKVVSTITDEIKTICKVRGITLNYSASQLVNFDVIRDMILNRGPLRVVTVHSEKKIKRKRRVGGVISIITEPEDKIYRISFFKRRRLNDNNSVPFGYI